MNSPRIPSRTPDPHGVLDYANTVLGIEADDWQLQGLLDAVIGYGRAVAASVNNAQAAKRGESLLTAEEVRRQGGAAAMVAKPYEPTRVPTPQHSATPIGDTVGPDPRKS